MSMALENMGFDELLEANKKLEFQLKSYEFLNSSLVSHKSVLESRYSDLQAQKAVLETQKSTLEAKVSQIQFQIDQMNRLLFGAKRERFIQNRDENQMTLPFDVEPEKEVEKQQETITYVRTKNWAPGNWEAPGRFLVSIDGKKLERELGKNPRWNWEY